MLTLSIPQIHLFSLPQCLDFILPKLRQPPNYFLSPVWIPHPTHVSCNSESDLSWCAPAHISFHPQTPSAAHCPGNQVQRPVAVCKALHKALAPSTSLSASHTVALTSSLLMTFQFFTSTTWCLCRPITVLTPHLGSPQDYVHLSSVRVREPWSSAGKGHPRGQVIATVSKRGFATHSMISYPSQVRVLCSSP